MRKFLHALTVLLIVASFPSGAPAVLQVNYTGEFPQQKPVDVAVDEEGRLYVVDEDGYIYVKTESGELVRSWGKEDPLGAWKLKKPGGIAVYGGKLYITDSGTGNVLIFATDGKFVASFPSHGSSPEMYNLPNGIDVFGGVIYVADSVNKKIQVFGPDGIFLGSIGDKEEDHKKLKRPVDVALDYRGYVYVVDDKKRKVQIYHPSGRHYRSIPCEAPAAIAMDKDGFYVSDDKYKVRKFTFTGDNIITFGTPGKGRAQFGKIAGLASNAANKVIAADSGNGSIQFYAPESRQILTPETAPPPTSVRGIYNILAEDVVDVFWAGEDERLYAASAAEKAVLVIKNDLVVKTLKIEGVKPVAVTKDGEGYLWIIDSAKDAVLKMDTSGAVRLSIGSSGGKEGQLSGATDIAVSSRGFIHVADRGNERIQIFNQSGVFLASIGPKEGIRTVLESPVSVALDRGDNIYVLDDKRYSVVKFTREGKSAGAFGKEGKGPGEFKKPAALLVVNGEVFVVDRGNNNVQVFDLEGNFLRLFGAEGSNAGFSSPSSITVKDNTLFFVSDPGNRRIRAIELAYTPEPPSTVLVKSGMREINVSWPRADMELGGLISKYNVYRSENPVTEFKVIASTASNMHRDANVKPDRKYFYRVSAVAKDGNESCLTKPVESKAEKFSIDAPKGLKAEPTDKEIALTWEAVTDESFSHYAVYVKELGDFKLLGEVKTPGYTETGLRRGKKRTYRVTVFSTDGVESPPAEIKARTLRDKPSGIRESLSPVIDAPGKIIKKFKRKKKEEE